MELTSVTCGSRGGRSGIVLTDTMTIAKRGEVSVERAVLVEDMFPPRLVLREFVAAGLLTAVRQKRTGCELNRGDSLARVLALVECHMPEDGRPLLTN